MDRYQKAILKYYQCQNDIKSITSKIGNLLCDCQLKKMSSPYDEEHIKTCLQQAYANVHPEGEYQDVEAYIIDEHDGCIHCLNAHKLVLERKVKRQSFGRAKGQITKLAKELNKVRIL